MTEVSSTRIYEFCLLPNSTDRTLVQSPQHSSETHIFMDELNLPSIILRGMATLWWAIPLILLVWTFESSWFKGKLGEFLVNRAFKKHLNPASYTVLHDVTLPTEEGSTQIDHVVISLFGIFVVETKNMSGWIFGSAKNSKWAQTFHRRKFTFQNPLRQNFKHQKVLSELTGLPDSKLHSLIIFTGSATFKTSMPANVTRRAAGVMYIRSFDQQVLSAGETSRAIETIRAGRLAPGRATNRQHVAGLRERQQKSACPECDGPMVKRTAKRGTQAGNQFWGCIAFPKCKGTLPVE
jgi:restriction system protein